MLNRFIVQSYPGKEISAESAANAQFAVLTSAALSGRLAVMNVAVNGRDGLVFDKPTQIDATIVKTIADIESSAIQSLGVIPTIAITAPSRLMLEGGHRSAINAISFPEYT